MRLFKRWCRNFVVAILGWQVRRLRAKNSFKIIGVVGSYGKTSTKFVVAHVLKHYVRTNFQAGNYNDLVSVPLIFFREELPSLLNPLAWFFLFLRNEGQLRHTYPYDVVVVELGTDGPGQIQAFQRYLNLDMTIVTAIAQEHMEFFSDVSAVATEELIVANFSDMLIINTDLCDSFYLSALGKPFISFGEKSPIDYALTNVKFKDKSYSFEIHHDTQKWPKISYRGLARMQIYAVCAAAIVVDKLQLPHEKFQHSLRALPPVSGRMQVLDGIRGSTILDESYNASPEATKSALDLLYDLPASQKIAVLGNMNELGHHAKAAHEAIGNYCNPKELAMVLTLGPEANAYLAPAAHTRGCEVISFKTPYEVGQYLEENITPGALVLIKGSQNGVFAEEAIKSILANKEDTRLLVRQSAKWLKLKQKSFGHK